MKKKLTLLLVFALVLTMIPAPASAALKSAGSPTEVQTLVSSENLEHDFVKVTCKRQYPAYRSGNSGQIPGIQHFRPSKRPQLKRLGWTHLCYRYG